MTNESLKSHLHWASWLLRLSIGTLFLCAAIVKAHLGIPGTIGYYSSLFEKSLLPHFLVTAHASVIIFIEFGLAFWLFSGFQLELAWKIAALLLLSLAIGMIFAGKYDLASDNYVYVFLCIAGLLNEFVRSFGNQREGVIPRAHSRVANRRSGFRLLLDNVERVR